MNASTFRDRWTKKFLGSSHFLEILEILLDNLLTQKNSHLFYLALFWNQEFCVLLLEVITQITSG